MKQAIGSLMMRPQSRPGWKFSAICILSVVSGMVGIVSLLPGNAPAIDGMIHVGLAGAPLLSMSMLRLPVFRLSPRNAIMQSYALCLSFAVIAGVVARP